MKSVDELRSLPFGAEYGIGRSHACPVCDSRDPKRLILSKKNYTLFACSCGAQYVYPFPSAEEIALLYSNPSYFKSHQAKVGYPDYSAEKPNLRRTARQRLAAIAKFAPPPQRILEIGAAYSKSTNSLETESVVPLVTIGIPTYL